MAEPPGPLRRVTRRYGWAATAWRVQQRFSEVHGNQLAAAVTLSAFLALFPLLLSLIAVAGFVAHDRPDFAADLVARLGLTGSAASTVVKAVGHADETRVGASVVGFAGLLWSGLGLVGALEAGLDTVWQVGGRGVKGKLLDLLWLVGAIAILAASVALTALLNVLPGVLASVTVVAGVGVNAVLFLWTFKVLTNRRVPWRAHLPGAVLGAAGLQALTTLGAVYVPRAVASSSELYGPIGVVLAILGWLLLFGRLVIYAACLDVVRWEEDHGTVTVEVELPRIPGEVATGATRAGEELKPSA